MNISTSSSTWNYLKEQENMMFLPS